MVQNDQIFFDRLIDSKIENKVKDIALKHFNTKFQWLIALFAGLSFFLMVHVNIVKPFKENPNSSYTATQIAEKTYILAGHNYLLMHGILKELTEKGKLEKCDKGSGFQIAS